MTTLPQILIVDDDHDALDLVEMFLYKSYDVVTAMNGFEALAKVESQRPALIMTDIRMPVMDGIRFLNSLRRNPASREIPVVAITSFTKEHTVKSLTSLGFVAVITKPPDGKIVADTVAGILGPPRHPGGRGGRRSS